MDPFSLELASCISASREIVARILGDLVRGGYLQIEGPRMILAGKLPSAR